MLLCSEKKPTEKPRQITEFRNFEPLSIACGLDLDIGLTERLLQLAGHAFNESTEHQALRFCITGLSGHSIEDRDVRLNTELVQQAITMALGQWCRNRQP